LVQPPSDWFSPQHPTGNSNTGVGLSGLIEYQECIPANDHSFQY